MLAVETCQIHWICTTTSRKTTIQFFQVNTLPPLIKRYPTSSFPCVCGVFLSGQFVKGSPEPPKGNAVVLHELMENLPCNAFGNKQCTNKCLDSIVKYLPNSPALVCGSIDRDCYKERAYLFIKNCSDTWVNTNMSAGREYCCKEGISYKCPLIQ
ncbi:hypothetical protein L9F63_002052 [Diploptera punctata]|uniref:Follicle cell protein 3C-1 n=2 Tax=Diploptera punctata TaxID=6984 RepID=A0AAD8EII4_DIPPU|nr:hypothetical protein L9F63_002052 [Diploptera punctata]